MSSAVESATLAGSVPPAMSAELSLNAMLNNSRPASGGRAPAASQPLTLTSRPLSAGEGILNATQRQSSMPSNANLSARCGFDQLHPLPYEAQLCPWQSLTHVVIDSCNSAWQSCYCLG